MLLGNWIIKIDIWIIAADGLDTKQNSANVENAAFLQTIDGTVFIQNIPFLCRQTQVYHSSFLLILCLHWPNLYVYWKINTSKNRIISKEIYVVSNYYKRVDKFIGCIFSKKIYICMFFYNFIANDFYDSVQDAPGLWRTSQWILVLLSLQSMLVFGTLCVCLLDYFPGFHCLALISVPSLLQSNLCTIVQSFFGGSLWMVSLATKV